MPDKVHSIWGGSAADRWMNCAGSTALIATVPERPESAYAREGTAAHTLAAECLRRDCHPRDFLGLWWQGDDTFADATAEFQVTEDMCDAVVVYLNAVAHELAQTPEAELYVEQGFVLDVASAEPGEVFGTNDAMVWHPRTGKLVVFDYKHGAGVPVTVEDNAQLKFYATGAIWSKGLAPAAVELVIVQPRLPSYLNIEPVQRCPIDPLSLMDFHTDVEDAIARAKKVHFGPGRDPSSDYGLKSGKWCKWCDAAPVCPLKDKEALDAAQLAFGSVAEITADALPEPKTLDTERLAAILQGASILNAWVGQIQEYVEALVLAGTSVPGWKAVEKIGRAKWVAADEAVATEAGLLFGIDEDLIRPRKLVTITEAEKLLKSAGAVKDDIDSFKLKFTLKESSGLTIAPESDKRPAVNAAARDFGSLNTDGLKV